MRDLCVCIGHSHAIAFADAGDPDLDVINAWDTGDPWVRDQGTKQLRPDLAERVARGRLVMSVLGGSAHSVLGQVEHPRPFDLVLPAEPDLPFDERRELVPADAVRAKLLEICEEHLREIAIVSRLVSAPLVHIEPPPPVADAKRIIPHIPWHYYPGRARVVAPKWVRYKVWRLHCEVIAAACAQIGVRYARTPDCARDGEGFLDLRYDADGAHANGAFGALVLKELGRFA